MQLKENRKFMNYLLDTNIVSLALKQNSQILHKITISESKEEKIFISCITYFEIRRGFLAVDVLIAATAILKDLIVVSNDSDLARVEGLSLENWVEL